MTSITYPRSSWPQFSQEEQTAVLAVLQSGKVNYWTGQQCQLFEQEFAAYHQCEYAIALANGTLALELALKALGIGPNDEVIVPSRTFIATASAVVACGARPVVADIDLVSQNITPDTIKPWITANTKAIIAVHLAGWPCDMPAIMQLAQKHGLKVIEDCAQAHGARIENRPIGSFGHAAAFSFCQDKIITTGGEGGMLLTNDRVLWERAWSYKDHGKHPLTAPHSQVSAPKNNHFRFVHEQFGTNFRMTEMQAAIGRVQLQKLPQWLTMRQKNAQMLNEVLQHQNEFRLTLPPVSITHAYYKYYVFLSTDLAKSGLHNQRFLEQSQEEGLPCVSGICPEIYREKAFTQKSWQPPQPLPNAIQLGQTSLMLAVDPTLSEADMLLYAKGLQRALSACLAACVLT